MRCASENDENPCGVWGCRNDATKVHRACRKDARREERLIKNALTLPKITKIHAGGGSFSKSSAKVVKKMTRAGRVPFKKMNDTVYSVRCRVYSVQCTF